MTPTNPLVGPTLAYKSPRVRSLAIEMIGIDSTTRKFGEFTWNTALLPVGPALAVSVTSVPAPLTETIPDHCPEVNFNALYASTGKGPFALSAVNWIVPVKVRTTAPEDDRAFMRIRNGTYAAFGELIVEKSK